MLKFEIVIITGQPYVLEAQTMKKVVKEIKKKESFGPEVE